MALPGPGWRHVIEKAAMLVVSQDDDAVLPEWAVANGVDDLRDKSLATLNVGRRMLIVFILDAQHAKVWVDESNSGQRRQPGLACKLP